MGADHTSPSAACSSFPALRGAPTASARRPPRIPPHVTMSRGRGETGLRAGFRCRWANALGGSSPSARTRCLIRRAPASAAGPGAPPGRERTTPASAGTIASSQGSELMAMRAVSKTVNPGSNPGSPASPPPVTAHTVYRTFTTARRREFVRITEDVAEAVREAGIAEGMVLVAQCTSPPASGSTTTSRGCRQDALEWLDKLAPPSWQEPGERGGARTAARSGRLPPPPRRRGQRRRAPQEPARPPPGDRPRDRGRLDLGPWQQVFYCEFDGGRPKRLVIKVLGE